MGYRLRQKLLFTTFYLLPFFRERGVRKTQAKDSILQIQIKCCIKFALRKSWIEA